MNEQLTSDLPEAIHRLNKVKDDIEGVNDDLSRQEIYDLLDGVVYTIRDIAADLNSINRVLRAVVDA